MNATQTAYMIAKAAFDTAVSQKHAALHPFAYLLDSDKGIEEYTDLEIKFNEEFQCDVYRAALRQAEDALIDWAFKKVQRSKHCTTLHVKTMSYLRENIQKPGVRRQLVDVSFRLR